MIIWPTLTHQIQPHANSVDATRHSDGKLVFIKRMATKSEEFKVLMLLNNDTNRKHSGNCCVPILDHFPDLFERGYTFVVMPFLRPVLSNCFSTYADLIDFVSQALAVNVPVLPT